jgi:hypothetical protein
MTDRIVTLACTAIGFALITGPAVAGLPIGVPEPATMSLFGVGVAGAFIARKLIRRR